MGKVGKAAIHERRRNNLNQRHYVKEHMKTFGFNTLALLHLALRSTPNVLTPNVIK